jgi:hypothetical protein
LIPQQARSSLKAALVSRLFCIIRSSAFPSSSTARHRYICSPPIEHAANIVKARALLGAPAPPLAGAPGDTVAPADRTGAPEPCPCCGGRMILIEIFERGQAPKTLRAATDIERRDSS